VIRVETDKKMDVISHAPDGSRFAPQSSECSAKVAMEIAAPAGVDEGFAVLGAEDEVIIERGRSIP
jgi:hypothetical protein